AAALSEEHGRFAIADGATESSFAALWARLLVAEFAAAPHPDLAPWAAWLPGLQQRWAEQVGNHALPWYAEAKIQQGAFATFLGLVVRALRWQAVAVGDSCLFQTRGEELRYSFPVFCAADFDTSPWLVGSRGADAATVERRSRRAEGDWQAGDRLW